MIFNINNYVRVRLTPYGERMLDKYHADRMERLAKFDLSIDRPKSDGDGLYEFQMHELMCIFGEKEMSVAGMPSPFVRCEIDIPKQS